MDTLVFRSLEQLFGLYLGNRDCSASMGIGLFMTSEASGL